MVGFTVGFYFYGILWFFNLALVLGNYLLMRFLPRNAGANSMMIFSVIMLGSASLYHEYKD